MERKDLKINGKQYFFTTDWKRDRISKISGTGAIAPPAFPNPPILPPFPEIPQQESSSIHTVEAVNIAFPTSRISEVVIPTKILGEMELRVESIFRPKIKDDETAYALTGINAIDMLHRLTTSEVITSATPNQITTITNKKILHIIAERGTIFNLLVDVHTHPNGLCALSDQDKKTHKEEAKFYREQIPGLLVYFGVHAVSPEGMKDRSEPEIHQNKIKWNSHIRTHEVGFFDENANPVNIMLSKYSV